MEIKTKTILNATVIISNKNAHQNENENIFVMI